MLNQAVQEAYGGQPTTTIPTQTANTIGQNRTTRAGQDGTHCLQMTFEQASKFSVVNVNLVNKCSTAVYAVTCKPVRNSPSDRTCSDGNFRINTYLTPGYTAQITYLMDVTEKPPIYGGCIAPAGVDNISYSDGKIKINCIIDDTTVSKGAN